MTNSIGQPAGKLPADPPDEQPPILGTWPKLYTFVLVYLAAVIFLFWLFTLHYAPVS